MIVGYIKGTKDDFFYNPKDQTMIVSTHATFLKESYMNDFKPQSKEVLEKLSRNTQSRIGTVPEPTPNSRPAND